MVIRQRSWLMVPGVLATAGSAAAGSDPAGNTIRQGTECEVDNTGIISPDIVPGASADTTMDARCRNRLFGTSRLSDSSVNQQAHCDTDARARHVQQGNDCMDRNSSEFGDVENSPGANADTVLSASCRNIVVGS